MYTDWSNLMLKYKGKWVALDKDETKVLVSSSSAKNTLEKAHKLGHANPIVTKVPTKIVNYIS